MIQHSSAPEARRSPPDRPASQQAADLLRGVLEALPVGIGVFELKDGVFKFRCGNREFARVLSIEPPPGDGALVDNVFDRGERDAIIKLFRRVTGSREPQTYFAAETTDERGTSRIWNVDAYPVFSAGRLSHVMVLAEQTHEQLEVRQRQQLEATRLREKADHLAELEKAKSEFLRLASHELRGPAAMLGGYLSMLEEESLGPIPDRLRPVLPLLRAKAAQINMLANEMVEAARLEDRRLQLQRKRVDLRDILRRAVQTARASATKGHRLHFDDRVGGELPVLADLMRLEIIFGNLLDNAIKYSPAGGEITVRLTVAGDRALVSVKDAGIGIAPEDMDQLFIRFNRLAPQPGVPGTGLGLYLARELARLHGGDIVAASEAGKGSEFTLSLPREPREE